MHDQMTGLVAYAGELAKAELLPKPYQRKPAMILVAMEMARDLGCSVVAVMNGTYEIGGRVAFYTDFMLAQARRSGVIKSVGYSTTGEGQSLAVTANAVMAGGEVVEATATLKEAQAEGYAGRNPKYKTMPEQMLRKRALKRLISNFCPEVMLGTSTEDDEDTPALEAKPTAVSRLTARLSAKSAAADAPGDVIEAEQAPAQATVVDVEPPTAPPAPPAPPARPKPKAATPERLADVKAAVEGQLAAAGAPPDTEASIQGPTVPFDFGDKAHRALVTQVFNEMEIPGRWRTLHVGKLEAFLRARDLRATLEDVGEAVQEYVLANPPVPPQPARVPAKEHA